MCVAPGPQQRPIHPSEASFGSPQLRVSPILTSPKASKQHTPQPHEPRKPPRAQAQRLSFFRTKCHTDSPVRLWILERTFPQLALFNHQLVGPVLDVPSSTRQVRGCICPGIQMFRHHAFDSSELITTISPCDPARLQWPWRRGDPARSCMLAGNCFGGSAGKASGPVVLHASSLSLAEALVVGLRQGLCEALELAKNNTPSQSSHGALAAHTTLHVFLQPLEFLRQLVKFEDVSHIWPQTISAKACAAVRGEVFSGADRTTPSSLSITVPKLSFRPPRQLLPMCALVPSDPLVFFCCCCCCSETTEARKMSMPTKSCANWQGSPRWRRTLHHRGLQKLALNSGTTRRSTKKWPKRPKKPSNRLAAINTAI